MTALQVVSYEPCGKTALCAGIGKKLVNTGRKVGYIKPVNIAGETNGTSCQDELFMNDALDLGGQKDNLCAFNISQEELWRNLSEDMDNFTAQIKSACDRAAAGKDVLIIESPGSIKGDQVSALACYTIAEKLNSHVVMLVCYPGTDAEIIQVVEKLGERLVGFVLNQVPLNKIDTARVQIEELLKSKGVKVLGVLPESRTLLGISVAEIASSLGGEIISSREKGGELVENVMLGAMSPDSARDYYDRKRNKAVVLRTERPDMQLAALETSVKCLIVSAKKPSGPVMVKAEDKRVPVVIVNQEINEIITGIERALAEAKFRQLQKLPAISAILDSGFDFKTLTSALAL